MSFYCGQGQKRNYSLFISISIIQAKTSKFLQNNSVHFLDFEIYKDKDGFLHSTIYRKTTTRKLYNPKSCHPKHLKENIPYCQRRTICDKESDFYQKAEDMEYRFFKEAMIRQLFKRLQVKLKI